MALKQFLDFWLLTGRSRQQRRTFQLAVDHVRLLLGNVSRCELAVRRGCERSPSSRLSWQPSPRPSVSFIQRVTSDNFTAGDNKAAMVTVATALTADEHRSFNRIRQVLFTCTPTNTWFNCPCKTTSQTIPQSVQPFLQYSQSRPTH